MAVDSFRDNARKILAHALDDVDNENRDAVLDAYTEMLTQLYAVESYNLLNEVIADARTRLDARLSPDPLRQTIASVQTTVQDLWRNIFGN
jgi:hypothetical protein